MKQNEATKPKYYRSKPIKPKKTKSRKKSTHFQANKESLSPTYPQKLGH